MAKLIVLRKGGGGKVAINPDLVAYVRSATGAFTDVFFDGQQVAVEGTFQEVVTALTTPDRRAPQPVPSGLQETQDGLGLKRPGG